MKDFVNPAKVIKMLKLRRNMSAVDFGSGSGGWVMPLARRLEDGLVYAIDVLEEPLSALRGRMSLGKISNIRVIRSDVEKKSGSTLPDSSVDLVLMTNLLFQAEDKKIIFEEAKRILKKRGKILVVDWKRDSSQGPKEGGVSETEVKKIAEKSGFELENEFEAGVYHYGLVFSRH
jgi:ubiquinone/menaquinone biosynthesis C-methylase UbiE